MWPFSTILRKKCVDEIRDTINQRGIALLEFYLTTDRVDGHWVDPSCEFVIDHCDHIKYNVARRKLEELKRTRKSYSLDVVVQNVKLKYKPDGWLCHDVPEMPEGHYPIGKTKNPSYGAELAEHRTEIRKLEEQGIFTMTPEEEGELEKRLHSRYDYLFRKYGTYETWEKYIEENDGDCPHCYGDGNIYGWDQHGTTVESTCDLCSGSGKLNLSDIQKHRKETDKEVHEFRERLVQNRRNAKISLLQHENENLLVPTERAQVYVKIVPL